MMKYDTIKVICFLSALISICISLTYTQLRLNQKSNNEVGLKKTNDTNNKVLGNQNEKQRIVIIAGPHKTGTSSLQYNFFQWTKHNSNLGMQNTTLWDDWVWPIPSFMEQLYGQERDDKNNKHPSLSYASYTSKVYYPLMEALRSPDRDIKDRLIFKSLSIDEIINMYHSTLQNVWDMGSNIVFGSEAMDLIVKLEEGPEMIDSLINRILPKSANDDQITVVVTYRSPKIDHLISQWHQVIFQKSNTQSFFKWITTTKNNLGTLDPLGMVTMFLKYTKWNVALVDFEWVQENGWDLTDYVACHFLQVECDFDNKQIKKLEEENGIADIKNVRHYGKSPNVSDETRAEMNDILMTYDCIYYESLLKEKNERIILPHKLSIDRLIAHCQSLSTDALFTTREEMKKELVKVVKKHGATSRSMLRN